MTLKTEQKYVLDLSFKKSLVLVNPGFLEIQN